MNKNTLLALVAFGGLLAAGAFVLTRDKASGITRVTLAAVDTTNVDAIELSGKNTAKLAKKDGQWKIETAGGEKLADESMVKRLLEAVPKVVSSDLVTNAAAKFAEYEVDDEKGTHVKVSAAGKTVADFVVGKSAKGGTHLKLGDEVFAVAGVYGSSFARPGGDWVDKKIFLDKVEEVQKVTVGLAGKPSYTLVKKGEEWAVDGSVLPKGFRFDAAAAKRLVSSLVALRAKDVVDADPGEETTKLAAGDVLTYTVKTGDTETVREVRLGSTKDGATFVKVTGRNDLYTVYESTVTGLKKQPAELRDLAMMKLDSAKVKQLIVTDGKKKLVLEKKGADWAVATWSEKVPADFTLDPAAVTRRLSALANARATEVAAVASAAAGLSAPSGSVTAVLEDNTKALLLFGKTVKEKDKEVIYARGNADDAVYAITTYMKNNLVGGLDTFKKRADEGDGAGLAGLDPKQLSGLPPEVRAQLEQQIQQKKREQDIMKRLQQQGAGAPH